MMAKGWVQRMVREPLLHFMLAGLAVFLLFSWRGNEADPASRIIKISEAQVTGLTVRFTQVWQRPPNPGEIDALIRDHIKEEVYYREALRLGLDRDDSIIRRRLRSKMEFLAVAKADSAQPSDKVLQQLIDAVPAKYARGTRYTFDQVYLGMKATDAKIKATLAQLQAKPISDRTWQQMGEQLGIPASMDNVGIEAIEKQFGDTFADALSRITIDGITKGNIQSTDRWKGPINSGFGTHLVRIRVRQLSAPPLLSDVRVQAENDWRMMTKTRREELAYQTLLDGYTIKIAKP